MKGFNESVTCSFLVGGLAVGIEAVPHGGHDLRDVAEGCVRVGSFDRGLGSTLKNFIV